LPVDNTQCFAYKRCVNIAPVRIVRDSQGLALFMVIFVMAFFLLFITGSLVFSQLELKKTNNTRLVTQALEVADAGLQHALAVIGSGYEFDSQLNCITPPCTVISQTQFPSNFGFSYTVTAKNDDTDIQNGGSATNDTNRMIILNSISSGPNGTTKEAQAYVKRSLVSFLPPGAVYLPAGSATITFDTGSGFFISGNDTGYNGSPASSPAASTIGAATVHNAVRDAFKTALGSSRYSLAQGAGYSSGATITPSVTTTTTVFDVNQIALNFYNYGGTVKYLNGLHTSAASCSSTNPCILGTDAAPQITYIRESTDKHIHLDGYVTGSGVLVTEGKAHIYGDFNFHGVIVSVSLGVTGGSGNGLDDLDPFSMRNNAKLFGGLLIGPASDSQKFDMRNNAKIYYSSQAMAMVNSLCGTCVPQPPRVFAWLDK